MFLHIYISLIPKHAFPLEIMIWNWSSELGFFYYNFFLFQWRIDFSTCKQKILFFITFSRNMLIYVAKYRKMLAKQINDFWNASIVWIQHLLAEKMLIPKTYFDLRLIHIVLACEVIRNTYYCNCSKWAVLYISEMNINAADFQMKVQLLCLKYSDRKKN